MPIPATGAQKTPPSDEVTSTSDTPKASPATSSDQKRADAFDAQKRYMDQRFGRGRPPGRKLPG